MHHISHLYAQACMTYFLKKAMALRSFTQVLIPIDVTETHSRMTQYHTRY